MALPEIGNPHQALAAGMEDVLRHRVEEAVPVQTLSTRGDKVLQVLEEPDGQKFVARCYSMRAVQAMVRPLGSLEGELTFPEAWDAMQDAFSAADIPVVPNALLRDVGGYPYVGLSEHVEGGKSLARASTETKEEVARGLGRLLSAETDWDFVPSLDTINADMFVVRETPDGGEEAQLIDTDPYLRRDFGNGSPTPIDGILIDKISSLFWDAWCRPEEREPVLTEFIKSIADFAVVAVENDFGGRVSQAFQKAHLMSNGLDARELAA